MASHLKRSQVQFIYVFSTVYSWLFSSSPLPRKKKVFKDSLNIRRLGISNPTTEIMARKEITNPVWIQRHLAILNVRQATNPVWFQWHCTIKETTNLVWIQWNCTKEDTTNRVWIQWHWLKKEITSPVWIQSHVAILNVRQATNPVWIQWHCTIKGTTL